jgi:hypothetical protein
MNVQPQSTQPQSMSLHHMLPCVAAALGAASVQVRLPPPTVDTFTLTIQAYHCIISFPVWLLLL